MPESRSQISIEQLADSFAARLERGERPSIDEYKQKYPQLADRIDAVFPALVMLENVESQASGPKLAVDDSIPQTLGDYQIIQEIGRGGMGIVFEARHATMRRRVALKVLPKSASEKPSYLSRFLTEARSAGQLHHTNIVPVFEVGESDGLHYYAMQYIHGDNLDRVISDLRRLRNSTGRLSDKTRRESAVNRTGNLNVVDQRLANGNRQPLPGFSGNEEYEANLSESVALGLVFGEDGADSQAQTVASPPGFSPPDGPNSSAPDSELANSNSPGLSDSVFGSQDTSTLVRARSIYHQRVAAVGLQVAEALDHAHNHGVLHRDVKPSNLILDTDGTVWITDFGLAKIEHDDLTHTGDIIGTLRYMAPERFTGNADRRSDIYSLGLTLYEMCTLKYAFKNVDQANLIREVSSRTPDPPRKIDDTIPLDLETIVLKAIEPQPERRYQTAGELADDLKLFLSDRPIKARRVSLPERFWRGCRRNPVLATMGACIAALLMLLAIGSMQFAFYSASQTRAALAAKTESQKNLYDSRLDQAKMRRFSRRLGQREKSLNAIQQATALLPELEMNPSEEAQARLALRNEAVAALALTDLTTEWSASTGSLWGQRKRFALDKNYNVSARGHEDGRIRVEFLNETDERPALTLPGPGVPAWVITISPNGRYVAARHHKPNAPIRDFVLYLWDLEKPDEPQFVDVGSWHHRFSPDSQHLAIVAGKHVNVLRLTDFEIVQTITPDFSPRQIDFSECGTRLAVTQSGGPGIEIWDLAGNGSRQWVGQVDQNITALDWQSDRSILAVGTGRGGVYYWRGEMNVEPRYLSVHQNTITHLHIHPVRDLVATTAWDSTVRLTNLVANRESLRVEQSSLLFTGFSSDGRLCYYDNQLDSVGIWHVSEPLLDVFSESGSYGQSARFHPRYPQLIARAIEGGVEFWDTDRRRLVHRLEIPRLRDILFSHDGRFLFTSDGVAGLRRWPLEIALGSNTPIEIALDEPVTLINTPTNRMAMTGSGDTIVAGVGFRPVAIKTSDGTVVRKFPSHNNLSRLDITADDRYLLTGTWHGQGAGVWDMETGQLVKMLLKDKTSLTVAAHPRDEKVFITAGDGIRFWEIGNWETPPVHIPVTLSTASGHYTRDGRLLGINVGTYHLLLQDPQTGREIATLETAGPGRMINFEFSADGNRLALSCYEDLQLWDLVRLRKELQRLGLDWPGHESN